MVNLRYYLNDYLKKLEDILVKLFHRLKGEMVIQNSIISNFAISTSDGNRKGYSRLC